MKKNVSKETKRYEQNWTALNWVWFVLDTTAKRKGLFSGQGDERGSSSGSGKWTAWHDGGLGFLFGGKGDGKGRHGRDPAARGEEGIGTECGSGSDSGSNSGFVFCSWF